MAFPLRLPVPTWMANLQELSLLGALKMWHSSPLIFWSRNSTGQSAAREWYVPHSSLLVFVAALGQLTSIVLSCLAVVLKQSRPLWGASQVALVVKNPPTSAGDVEEMWVRSLGWEDLERAWRPTPVFLPRETLGQRSLAGYKSITSQLKRLSMHAHAPEDLLPFLSITSFLEVQFFTEYYFFPFSFFFFKINSISHSTFVL